MLAATTVGRRGVILKAMSKLATGPTADQTAAVRRPGSANGSSTIRRWPIATLSILAVTAVPTELQFPFPAVRRVLWRDPDALAAGQWWRLVTAPFLQSDLRVADPHRVRVHRRDRRHRRAAVRSRPLAAAVARQASHGRPGLLRRRAGRGASAWAMT